MPAFFEYLRNITYYLMFVTVAGMIAPEGKYKKFVSLVMGFILLGVMLAPLASFSGDIPITQWFSGIIPQETINAETTYTRWRNTYLQTAFEYQLESQLSAMLYQNGFTLYNANFTYTDDFSRITSLSVTVNPTSYETRRVPFIRIEPVRITPQAEYQYCQTAAEVKNLISQFYNLPQSHIYVNVQQIPQR